MTRETAIGRIIGYLTYYLPSDKNEEVEEIINALHSSLTKEDLDKILDVEHEKTMSVTIQTPQGKQVRYIKYDVLDKIRTEIEEEYGGYDICEWYEDYDYEDNDTSEYMRVGTVSEILDIIDKYKFE